MDRKRIVAGLDVHKDMIFLYIMRYDEAILFEKSYGVLSTDLRTMREAIFVFRFPNKKQ